MLEKCGMVEKCGMLEKYAYGMLESWLEREERAERAERDALGLHCVPAEGTPR